MNDAIPNEFKQSVILAAELEKECKTKEKTNLVTSYAPLPLQRMAILPKKFPFEALGEVVGAAAKRVFEVVQAPDATCGQSFLAALSLACQGFVDVQVDGRISPTSLFMLTISDSGERKSAVDKIALKPINDWQKSLVGQYNKQFADYKNKYEIWNIKRQAAIKEAAATGDENLSYFEAEPQLPCEGIILCEEPTLEGMQQLLERGQPSAGIFSDEGGRLVGGHALNAENALKTACGLSNLWDGKPITRVRKSDGNKILYGRRLALHLMIQPIVLVQLLNNDILMGQGLLARCLFSFPMPMAGSRKYKEVDLSKDSAILAFYDLINRMLDRPFIKMKFDSERDNVFRPGDALEPFPILLEEDAKRKWVQFHDETDSKMNEDGEYHPIKSFASKAAEQVLRIAALFAFSEKVLDPSEQKSKSEDMREIKINLECLNRAIMLVVYYLQETLRILGKSSGDPDVYLAVQTLEWIKRCRLNQIFPMADVYQKGPNQIRSARKAKKIMRILEEHELVIEVPDALIDGKKVRSAWRLVNEQE